MRGKPRTGGHRAWFGARWALCEVVCVRWPRGALDSPRASCWGEARAARGEGPWEAIHEAAVSDKPQQGSKLPAAVSSHCALLLRVVSCCRGRGGAGGAAAGRRGPLALGREKLGWALVGAWRGGEEGQHRVCYPTPSNQRAGERARRGRRLLPLSPHPTY